MARVELRTPEGGTVSLDPAQASAGEPSDGGTWISLAPEAGLLIVSGRATVSVGTPGGPITMDPSGVLACGTHEEVSEALGRRKG